MCGIGGILRVWSGQAPPPRDSLPARWVDAVASRLSHRGPDGSGLFADRIRLKDGSVVDTVLIHRRLAVIDPPCGAQPMVATDKVPWRQLPAPPQELPPPPPPGADDLLAIVFNGCIYNHRKLREELKKAGRTFRTDHSDTESILQGFAAWGPAVVSRLDGMFALALWDRRHGRIVAARDRAGEKPMYVAEFTPGGDDGRCLAFASTVPALVNLARAAGLEVSIGDPETLATWVRFGYGREIPIGIEGGTIREVPQGHVASTTPGLTGWSLKEYYAPPPQRDRARHITLDELDRVLSKAVADRLESDVELGCFLSGGIDSSLVAAYASRAKPGLKTFCVRMPDPRYDESSHAKAVARRLSTKHATLEVSAKPGEDLATLIGTLGLPLGDSSLLPSYWVSAAARRHVTVALSGDGGDELFMGYERYRGWELLRDYAPLLQILPDGLLARSHPRTKLHKLARLAVAARHGGYQELLSVFPTPDLARLMKGIEPRRSLLHENGGRIQDPALHDVTTYLPEDLLRKVDTASMQVALEVRSPLLAPAVMDLALLLPRSELLPGGVAKGLLRALARRYLPESIVQRGKAGFAIPVGEWFRSDYGGLRSLLSDLASSSGAWDSTGIDPRGVHALMAEHAKAVRDHGQRLYELTVIALWARDITRA